jgi:hypothetical protein
MPADAPLPAASTAPGEVPETTAAPGSFPAPEAALAVERWLADFGLQPSERSERDGVSSWDVVVDGRRRFDLRVTLILDSGFGLVVWAHYAPPIGDGFRKAYRRLLRWNDEFPFAKFGLTEDERPVLTVELAPDRISADELGLAIARVVGIADRLLDESVAWIWLGGRRPSGDADRTGRHGAFLDRFADRLPELLGS